MVRGRRADACVTWGDVTERHRGAGCAPTAAPLAAGVVAWSRVVVGVGVGGGG